MEFPTINKNQVTLLRAEHSTGIVLNAKFERCTIDEKQIYYTIFDSLDKAKEYINSHKLNQPNVEFIVQDITEEVIFSYYPNGWMNPYEKRREK
jgi:hypothetical protein